MVNLTIEELADLDFWRALTDHNGQWSINRIFANEQQSKAYFAQLRRRIEALEGK